MYVCSFALSVNIGDRNLERIMEVSKQGLITAMGTIDVRK